MSKYFIVAASYYTYTAMFLSDHVFSDEKCEFLLLKENHRLLDINCFDNIKITLCENIQSAVENCDYVWFIDSKLYQGIYGQVAVLSNKYNKKLILTKLDIAENICIDSSQKDLFYNKPTIVSIGIGDSSQQYCTEIFLNRMLNKKKINFDQIFSPTTKSTLENIAKNKLVNKNIVKQIFNPKHSGNVCIKGIAFETLSHLMSNIDEIKNWNVDIFIVNINQNMACDKETIHSLNGCFRRPVYFLCSPYVEVENNISRTLFIRTSNHSDIPMITDESARHELENNIIADLAYPPHAYKLI